ncbi:MAG: T9SS type A sorting domain-containing protein, partial [Bacteroidota bacterium]
RIAAIDLNGQQTYSERLRINLATSDLEILSLRYQQEEIQLHYTHHSTSPLRWELIDLNGRRVSMGDLDPLRGTSVHQIRVGALIPAVYVLRLYDEKQSLSRKFLVE